MIRFYELSAISRALLAIWIITLVPCYIYVTIRFFQMCYISHGILSAYVMVVVYLLAQTIFLTQIRSGLFHENEYGGLVKMLYEAPAFVIRAALLTLTIFWIISTYRFVKWRYNSITAMSVREAINLLPAGICLYRKEGQVCIVNLLMDELCYKLNGRYMQNGRLFWRKIQKGRIGSENTLLSEEHTPTIRFKDGRVFSFSQRALTLGNEKMYEIIATDVTQQYAKNVELEKRHEKLVAMNERIRKLNDEITAVTIEQEVLNMKVRIHNDLGAVLLSSEKYLSGNHSAEEKRSLLERWRRDVFLLAGEKRESTSDAYDLMRKTASDIQVNIIEDGELPEMPVAKEIVCVAMHESLTNTIRHAHGDSIFIKTEYTNKNEVIVTFTNNGNPPDREIVPGGGLSSLVKLVEREGGFMEIQSKPEFKMVLTLPYD